MYTTLPLCCLSLYESIFDGVIYTYSILFLQYLHRYSETYCELSDSIDNLKQLNLITVHHEWHFNKY